jgi:hypothetical protein
MGSPFGILSPSTSVSAPNAPVTTQEGPASGGSGKQNNTAQQGATVVNLSNVKLTGAKAQKKATTNTKSTSKNTPAAPASASGSDAASGGSEIGITTNNVSSDPTVTVAALTDSQQELEDTINGFEQIQTGAQAENLTALQTVANQSQSDVNFASQIAGMAEAQSALISEGAVTEPGNQVELTGDASTGATVSTFATPSTKDLLIISIALTVIGLAYYASKH